MTNNKNKRESISVHLPGTTISDLRGKQSVRATFKLSERTINAVSIVATHLGIKQKSLFDHLIEDIESLSAIVGNIRRAELKKREGVQKTYVISRKSLHSLDQISKDYDMPRDALVEFLMQRLLPIINRERETHRKRKKIANDIKQFVEMGRSVLNESKRMLGDDDPVYLKLRTVMNVTEHHAKDIDSFIERGSIIEDF